MFRSRRLKTSLLVDDDDFNVCPTVKGGPPGSNGRAGGGKGGGQMGRDSRDRNNNTPCGPAGGGGREGIAGAGGGREGSGEVLVGVWDEASAGDLKALSRALGPGGGGDVNACKVDGK